MRNHLHTYWKRYAAAKLTAILVTLALYLLGVFTTHAEAWLHSKVGGPHGTPVQTIAVPKEAVDEAKQALADHANARDEAPPGVSAAALNAAKRQQERLAFNDQLPIVTPLAAPEQRGCQTRLVRNYSSRQGVAPGAIVLHYTVSPNVKGWADNNSVLTVFDRAAFQASSNYIIDNEGHCYYIVRESDKAWTQAGANPYSVSIEVVNTGHEPTYAGIAGKHKLAMVISDIAYRWKIPIRQGLVRNCLLVRRGIVDHASLGKCGGGHHDIRPYSVAKVIQAVKDFRAAQAQAVIVAKARAKAKARAAVLLLRRQGASWPAVFKTPEWARYKALGGK